MANRESEPVTRQVRRALADRVNGWWVAATLDSFRFLESEFGYRLTEVTLHFRGSSLKYDGTTFDVVIAYDPQDTASLDGWFWIHDESQRRSDGSPMAFPVSELLRRRKPELTIPDSGRIGLDEIAVRETLRTWSHGLLELAPDVLRGAWPAEFDDVRPTGMPGQ